jgi:hypothetical protein
MARGSHDKKIVTRVVTQRVSYSIESVKLRDALLQGLMARIIETNPKAEPRIMLFEMGKQSIILSERPYGHAGRGALTIEGDADTPELKKLVDLIAQLAGGEREE